MNWTFDTKIDVVVDVSGHPNETRMKSAYVSIEGGSHWIQDSVDYIGKELSGLATRYQSHLSKFTLKTYDKDGESRKFQVTDSAGVYLMVSRRVDGGGSPMDIVALSTEEFDSDGQVMKFLFTIGKYEANMLRDESVPSFIGCDRFSINEGRVFHGGRQYFYGISPFTVFRSQSTG